MLPRRSLTFGRTDSPNINPMNTPPDPENPPTAVIPPPTYRAGRHTIYLEDINGKYIIMKIEWPIN